MEIRILSKNVTRPCAAYGTAVSSTNVEYFWELFDGAGRARVRSIDDLNAKKRYNTYFRQKIWAIDAAKRLMALLKPSVDILIYDCTGKKKMCIDIIYKN